MWKAKVINWVTNLFGGVAGVSEVMEGIVAFNEGNMGLAITKVAEGIGIFAIGYFTGKSALNHDPKA